MLQKNRLFQIIILCLSILLVILLFFSIYWTTHQSDKNEKVNIYLFWGAGCPSCELAKPALESIAERNTSVKLYTFEINFIKNNLDLFIKFSDAYGIVPQSVPTIFISNQAWVGYSVNVHREINAFLNYCLSEPCVDLGKPLLSEITLD